MLCEGSGKPGVNTRAVYNADGMLDELGELGRPDGVRVLGCGLAWVESFDKLPEDIISCI